MSIMPWLGGVFRAFYRALKAALYVVAKDRKPRDFSLLALPIFGVFTEYRHSRKIKTGRPARSF
jgi:hypothetical protein